MTWGDDDAAVNVDHGCWSPRSVRLACAGGRTAATDARERLPRWRCDRPVRVLDQREVRRRAWLLGRPSPVDAWRHASTRARVVHGGLADDAARWRTLGRTRALRERIGHRTQRYAR